MNRKIKIVLGVIIGWLLLAAGIMFLGNYMMRNSEAYTLRLLENTFEFIDKYVNLLENDTSLKFEHKEKWNKIISEGH